MTHNPAELRTDRGDSSPLRPSLKSAQLSAFVTDDVHVQIVKRTSGPDTPGHSLYLGSYDNTGSVSLYANTGALQTIMLAIAEHLRAVGDLSATVAATLAAMAESPNVELLAEVREDLAVGDAADAAARAST